MRPSFIRSVIHLPEVDSTSDHARRLIAAGPVETPCLVSADRQTRGRGQRSNAWWSDDGSLTATLVLDPVAIGLPPDREPRVALATAVAAIDAIEGLYPGCRPGIRWPNDIEVAGRKLGGILPERAESPAGPRLLIGVGVNVRTRLDAAPAAVRGMAASLLDWPEALPSSDPRAALLDAILAGLPDRLRALASGQADLPRRWVGLDALLGSTIRVEVGAATIEGVAAGIDAQGALRVDVGGEIRTLHAGRVLRDPP